MYDISEKFTTKSDVIIHHGDCLDFLKSIPNESIQLVVSSPPYNIGKTYELHQSMEAYVAWQEEVARELVRVLSNSGSICWETGNHVTKQEIIPLDFVFYKIFKDVGMKFRNRIIWHFEHGLHATKRLSGRYETILWFTKSDDYQFNLDSIRVPSKYPGKRHYKGPKKGKPSGNPAGKNPSDVWMIVESDWDRGIWDVPNVKSNHPEKTVHQCQFPVELAERCVLALSSEGQWVLDPFGGVGSTVIAAIKNDRKAAMADKEAEYVQLASSRVEQFGHGDLKFRPIGKPIHKPTGKLTEKPAEWR